MNGEAEGREHFQIGLFYYYWPGRNNSSFEVISPPGKYSPTSLNSHIPLQLEGTQLEDFIVN
jgi:hypothetical protein